MRAKTSIAILSLLVLASFDARAHFKLAEPADRLQTDQTGDPLGNNGSQKSSPCGEGTASGAITMVRAGAMLHVKLTETVAHGGHYRIALVPKLNPTSGDLPDPVTTVTNNNCVSAEIADPVTAPILADNLFPHAQAGAVSGKVWETDVLMPTQTGSATLQVIEFMTPHAPGCFYYHCAEIDIVEADASVPDGGMIIMPNDAGTNAPPGTTTPDGAAAPSAPGPGGDAATTSGGSGPRMVGIDPNQETSDCSIGGGTGSGVALLGTLGLALASIVRRTRARKRATLPRR